MIAIETSYEAYDDAVFTWRGDDKVTVTISPFHTLSDTMITLSISGFSTSNLSTLNGYLSKLVFHLFQTVGLGTTEIASAGAGTTEIYVTRDSYQEFLLVVVLGSELKLWKS